MAFYKSEEFKNEYKILLKLQCPFTWDMEDSCIKHATIYNNSKNEVDEIGDDRASCVLDLLIFYLLKCFKATISKPNNVDIEASIKKAEELLMKIQEKQEMNRTIRAIEHIFYATKCFLLYTMEKKDELLEILQNIIQIENFNDEELGTLYGCQSVVWSCFNNFGMNNAVIYAEKAVKKNQDCALWHFILAKNLRRQRRTIFIASKLRNMEQEHFEIAYAISKNHMFGIYYLHMRLERFFYLNAGITKINNERQVLKLAKEILGTHPTNCKVLLKLALIFLRVRQPDEGLLAKKCLDAVKNKAPNNATYLHYTGILYEQRGDYKEAIKYFKKAADCNNFPAEFSYVQRSWEIGQLDPLPYLLQMLEKYGNGIKEQKIKIFLAIAITYYLLHKDMTKAAEYLLKAFTIDPDNGIFKVFYKFLYFKTKSILIFLKDFFYEVEEYRATNATLDETCRKIKELMMTEDIADLMKNRLSLQCKEELDKN